jgi:nucleotide-binding universal stress UspA family protein
MEHMQNTNEVKVLGAGTSKHQMVSTVLKEYIDKAGISIDVKDYTDVDQFIKDGIDSIPAVIYKDKVINIGSNGSFNKTLRKAVNEVLKESNFGRIDKIVIPVDFSDVSSNAFAFGHRLATDLGAVTKAVHVFSPSAKELAESATVDVDFALLHNSYLEEFVATFDSDWGSDLMRTSLIDSEFRTGFPGEQILESIDDNKVFMTIMGTTGKSDVVRKWFGSVSTKVMNESTTPVLLVPQEAHYQGINKIAYAYENIDQDKSILEKLAFLANRLEAEIHLIHVEDGKDHPDPGFFLTELLTDHYPSSHIITSSIHDSNIVNGINDYCASNDIDVISLSTHKKNFFEKIYDDNISLQMTVASSLPLLILKDVQ